MNCDVSENFLIYVMKSAELKRNQMRTLFALSNSTKHQVDPTYKLLYHNNHLVTISLPLGKIHFVESKNGFSTYI